MKKLLINYYREKKLVLEKICKNVKKKLKDKNY